MEYFFVKWFKTLTCDDEKRPHPRRAVENCDRRLFEEEMAGFEKDTSVENGQMDCDAVVGGHHTTTTAKNIPNRNQSVSLSP